MASWQTFVLNAALRFAMKRHGDKGIDLDRVRRTTRTPRAQALVVPDGMRVTETTADPGLLFDVADRAAPRTSPPDAVVFYLHGGGYIFGSPKTHRQIAIALARVLDAPAWSLDYRLAPEHPYPAALDDAVRGYRHIRAEYPRARILVAGDSAGGGLALALMLRLRAEGVALPAGFIGYSPWTDLAVTGDSVAINAGRCAMFTPRGLMQAARLYVGAADARDPMISPLYGDLAGLPPLLLFASDDETLRDDTLRLAARARAAGVDVELVVERGLPHVWPIFVRLTPESRRALDTAAAFGRRVLSSDAGGKA